MAADKRNQQVNALLSLYSTLYEKKYRVSPVLNRYKLKWGMGDVLDSVGYDKGRELLEYYFRCERSDHSIQWFFNNFDELFLVMKELEADKKKRLRLAEETARRVQEWREMNERGSETD